MAMQPAICKSCGAQINVDDIDLNGFCECEYCHVSQKVIEVITIDGLPTVKSLLGSASLSMENGNYEKAVKLYNEVINIKPNCHEAWWGLYICNAYFDAFYNYEDKYGNRGPLTKANIMQNTINKYAARAIEYAPEQTANSYRRQISDQLSYIESARNGSLDKRDSQGKTGCYIATAVYGSYTCDEVYTLRRFRDERLSNSAPGRAFIKVYYKLSPSLAKHLPYDSAISNFIRNVLDSFVKHLENKFN